MNNGIEDTTYIIRASDLLKGFSDIEGDTLSITNLETSNGQLINNNDGTWTLKPSQDFNGDVSPDYFVGVRANTTFDYTSWDYVRSDEQPLWIDFKTHYTADWDRGIFDKRIPYAPVTFEISGIVRQQQNYGPFGNFLLKM
mgnify:CR=1 FL=1